MAGALARSVLTVVVYSLNMFGDAVRDRLDPRLRAAAVVWDTTAANGGEQHAAGKLKEFGLSCFAIGHPTSVVVLTLILIVTGFVSYFRVPRESMPEIVIPTSSSPPSPASTSSRSRHGP